MPRKKSERNLNFKPIVKSFVPENNIYTGISSLLHEEIEAIYLMDVLNLYQEDAAKKMQVSRPTFTRILKNARKKTGTALVSGYKINIEDTKDDCIIAFCSTDKNIFNEIDPLQKYILIYQIKDDKINLINTINNPVYSNKLKPASILPKVLMENSVNIFISSRIGEGLKSSLLSKGIKPIGIKQIDSLDNLLKLI